ncbi:MAG: sugar ABC transporter ATP-binding protein [Oscillibacter sp.]|nr:sugar ABC transporter ATP-binding protein [Oscillibacter sp.]
MSETILEAKGICKSFSGVPVLQDVRFEVKRGEVHALMGENGAGKSTLIKIITGVYSKDDGQIFWEGQPVEINSYQDCQKLGVACIYQELSVIPPLTVAQNVYLGREPRKGKLIDFKTMNRMTQELIDKYDFPLKAETVVDHLGIGQRQLIEILKGLSQNSKLLIMDEPTASLSGKEAESLFRIINTLRSEGVSIIYISHRLEEVYMLSDRLTILRDGKNAAVLEKKDIIPAKVIEIMIGKVVDESAGSKKRLHSEPNAEVRLDVRGLTDKSDRFRNISFQVRRGEILGLGGLIGAGRTEVVRAIYGVDKAASGEVYLDGKKLDPSPKNSILEGIGFVPEDRRGQGFIPLLSTTKNIALTNYDIVKTNKAFAPAGDLATAISDADELAMGKRAIEAIDIRPADPEKRVGDMSGGNAQKVVLGKWLMRDLKLLIVDEPTAGIDVGAKDEIYQILENLAKQGVAVIVVTSDLQELLRVSHRILVMRKGDIVREFKNEIVTQSRVLSAGQGVAEEEAAEEAAAIEKAEEGEA